MSKTKKTKQESSKQDFADLIKWNQKVVIGKGQDPLGLNLRVSAQLSRQLLFCITSVTPRARYYSFLMWCIDEYLKAKESNPSVMLDDVANYRERALVLGSVLHHEGETCAGGGLVGYRTAKRNYEKLKISKQIDLTKNKLAENPARNIYKGSLFNLGLFANLAESDSEIDDDDETEIEIGDDFKLSDVGQHIADQYLSNIKNLKILGQIRQRKPICSVECLRSLGKIGGLCELKYPESQDRHILRELFFNKLTTTNPSRSHEFRRQSLLLLMYFVSRCHNEGVSFNEMHFRHAVYYGEIPALKNRKPQTPTQLLDIALRWRMFYFHYYLTVGLESLLAYVVSKTRDAGLSGLKLDCIWGDLGRAQPEAFLKRPLKALPNITLEEVLTMFDLKYPTCADAADEFDQGLPLMHVLSEETLQSFLWQRSKLHTANGLLAAMLIILISLTRYRKWNVNSNPYGNWLFQANRNDPLNVTLPTVIAGLNDKFNEFQNAPLYDVLKYILYRYVLRQHQELSYVKSWDGGTLLITCDDDCVFWKNSDFERTTASNPRFDNAMQILEDLGYIKDYSTKDEIESLTPDGKRCLEAGLR